MTYAITDACINCEACKTVCPNKAVIMGYQHFMISHRCDECSTSESAHCASICPVENAIVNSRTEALNPPLSLGPDALLMSAIIKRQEVCI